MFSSVSICVYLWISVVKNQDFGLLQEVYGIGDMPTARWRDRRKQNRTQAETPTSSGDVVS
ncbi:hypothetical protein [Floridanema aerugineum]|uniref:Uncharacterized protein n=1 Tax=Floridaenema aerugineum BLCC-F46 TaxID=3153654 RepID=A0ABV4XEJ7_9CYAN